MRAVKNYCNYYITEDGEIYNKRTEKFLKGSVGENDYRYFRLSKNNKKKMFYAHRLVAEHYLESSYFEGAIVNHIDGNKLNNYFENLEWVTYSENTRHQHRIKSVIYKEIEFYDGNLDGERWITYKSYDISSLGRVKRKDRGNLLRPSICEGYLKVTLSNDGKKEDVFLHKIVFRLFGEEEVNDEKVIDHIDGNKLNNNIDNLRQITLSENTIFSICEQKLSSVAKQVEQYSIDGVFIGAFPSASMAGKKLGLDPSSISKVCQGINKTCGGYSFKYIQ